MLIFPSRPPRAIQQDTPLVVCYPAGMEMTLVLITLALVLFFALRGRRVKARDAAAEAARRAVEARLESGAAAQRDDDSRA